MVIQMLTDVATDDVELIVVAVSDGIGQHGGLCCCADMLLWVVVSMEEYNVLFC